MQPQSSITSDLHGKKIEEYIKESTYEITTCIEVEYRRIEPEKRSSCTASPTKSAWVKPEVLL